jgi:CBS domain-containing protein
VSRDTTVRNAVSLMLETGIEQVVVADGDRVLGTFSLSDVNSVL